MGVCPMSMPPPHTHSIDNDNNIDTNGCYDDEDDGVLKNDGNNDKLMGVYSIPYLLLIRTLSTMIVVRVYRWLPLSIHKNSNNDFCPI